MLSESLMSPEEKLKELFPGLKQLEISTQLDIGEENELHLLRIPRDVDPQVLLNLDLDIYEKAKFKLGDDEKFVIQPTPRTPKHTLVFTSESKVLDFKSNIIMTRYVKLKKDPLMFKSEKTVVPLPKNKNRHPLFGSNFEKAVELPKEIKEKLDNVLENLIKQDMKIKKRRKKCHKEDDTNEIIFSLLNTSPSPKEGKKTQVSDNSTMTSGEENKKAKTKTTEDTAHDIKNELCTEYETHCGINPSSSKTKKTKKSLIEESLRSIKSELFPDCESDSGIMSSSSKKNKKAKKSMDRKSLSNIESEVFTENETDSGISPSKKKKDKKLISGLDIDDSFIHSKQVEKETVNSSINFESDPLMRTTKKRKRSISFSRGSDSEGDITKNKSRKLTMSSNSEDNLNGFHVDTSPSKKVKKKKKQRLE